MRLRLAVVNCLPGLNPSVSPRSASLGKEPTDPLHPARCQKTDHIGHPALNPRTTIETGVHTAGLSEFRLDPLLALLGGRGFANLHQRL